MSGEELEGQRRELFGLDVVHCDICGVGIPTHDAIEIESPSSLAEHSESLLICPSCWKRIHAGELDLRTLLLDEEEVPD